MCPSFARRRRECVQCRPSDGQVRKHRPHRLAQIEDLLAALAADCTYVLRRLAKLRFVRGVICDFG
ncbi:MAG: hypothetical protein AAFY63_12390 [Cyanobacteria bacterium J06643_13]